MFVAHPPTPSTLPCTSPTHHPPFKHKFKSSSSSSKRKHAEMDVEDKHLVHKYVNEQGEHEERKMSVNCLLNTPQELVTIKTNGLHNSSNEISRISDSHHNSKDKPTYDDQYIEYVEGSPPTTPTFISVNATVPQRAPCSVCKNETGRCHASDPGRFDGVLNVADWLCMKCYSKWYNRCKRKASSAINLNVVDSSLPLPQQKRKRREREKDGHVPKVESDKKDSDRDTDSDDALLLARIGGNYPAITVPPSSSSEENADLESATIEELRTEVTKLRKEMRQMVNDIASRDEQVEGMMSFVRNEVALMHTLLKEIHTSKWSSSNSSISIPAPNSNPNSASSSASSSSSSLSSSSSSISAPSSGANHLPSLTSLPSLPLSFNVPSLHS